MIGNKVISNERFQTKRLFGMEEGVGAAQGI